MTYSRLKRYAGLLLAPLSPVVLPSLRCMAGLSVLYAGVYALIWHWLPESTLAFALVTSSIGPALLILRQRPAATTPLIQGVLHTLSWLFFIGLFSFAYLYTHGHAAWLVASIVALFIYNHLVDWRVALGGLLGGALVLLLGHLLWAWLPEDVFYGQSVIWLLCAAFAWGHNVSAAQWRHRLHLRTVISNKVIAGEFRSPLATMQLARTALDTQIQQAYLPLGIPATQQLLEELTESVNKTHSLIARQVQRERDLREENVLPEGPGFADKLMTHLIHKHSLRQTKIGKCIQLVVRRNFQVALPPPIFLTTFEVLIRSAIAAMAPPRECKLGDIKIEIDIVQGAGQITLTDHGLSIDPRYLPFIFNPPVGHLDAWHTLAYCQHVIEFVNGSIRAEPLGEQGNRFVVRLPLI